MQQRIIIFGNSGSGKSTLAKEYASQYGLAHLDLDTLAWQETTPPTRRPLKDSAQDIEQFLDKNQKWVIEGCYSDLLGLVMKEANEAVFLNLDVEACILNCSNRPWEPHKYASLKEQNENLNFLLEWIKQYPVRDDEFSLTSHQKLFDAFIGKKTVFRSNQRGT